MKLIELDKYDEIRNVLDWFEQSNLFKVDIQEDVGDAMRKLWKWAQKHSATVVAGAREDLDRAYSEAYKRGYDDGMMAVDQNKSELDKYKRQCNKLMSDLLGVAQEKTLLRRQVAKLKAENKALISAKHSTAAITYYVPAHTRRSCPL